MRTALEISKDSRSVATIQYADQKWSLLTDIYGFSFSFPIRSSISSPKRSDLLLFPCYSHPQNVVKFSQKMTFSGFKMSRQFNVDASMFQVPKHGIQWAV